MFFQNVPKKSEIGIGKSNGKNNVSILEYDVVYRNYQIKFSKLVDYYFFIVLNVKNSSQFEVKDTSAV